MLYDTLQSAFVSEGKLDFDVVKFYWESELPNINMNRPKDGHETDSDEFII